MPDIASITTLSVSDAVGVETTFTNWLAENIDQLAESLGFDMEPQGTQTRVGSYRADIVAKAETGELVVIEAQYGRTDHVHLGQILTYAGGIEAQIIVWIAETIRDEHRAALDWLNAHSGLRFFRHRSQGNQDR